MDSSPRDAVRERQREWYGEPLGDLFRRLIAGLGLNQARLAALLGLSAPMLSQLMSGQRAKIGNPAVVQRMQALLELAADVADGAVAAGEAAGRMELIRESAGGSLTGTTGSASNTAEGSLGRGVRQALPARAVVREIQALLRSMGSAQELVTASDALAAAHPELAEFLRVYGAGRTDDALSHFEAHQD
ncbi:DNA-binding protein [Streptomyces sp. ICBB 8177]|uniref:helix-turn-helix domain-containing protein n=1 Tax=Streptomyces sp. ICBB 8177 TaxID=563922 RepID=UPI000D6849FE|nr:DNA-binding protein [Streptomyces sp. ICBB 8177]PWI41203.1 DNA-binding protein [Streptomyces sp. ICBB 8177]